MSIAHHPAPAIAEQLQKHRDSMGEFSIATRVASDADSDFVAEGAGIALDFKKHLLTHDVFSLLSQWADATGLAARRNALFDGSLIGGLQVNSTEKRPALHTLLRTPRDKVPPSLHALHDEVTAARASMREISEKIRGRRWLGFSGRPITDIVNIGIGGSDLGPRMIYRALAPVTADALRCHFVSNIDPESIATTLAALDPATTLFIVASKSFTTQETLNNATTARRWLLQHGATDAQVASHFVAISAKPEQAVRFGIAETNVLAMWDWVGGRFSLWSAIGLPLAIALGFDTFERLLAGAHAMDQHFLQAPHSRNLPVILALLDHWYANYWQCHSHAIVPYCEQLELLPDYLQQLIMESVGKRVDHQGGTVAWNTSPVVWGTAGTNGQHSYFQLLHQGTHFINCDFIVPLTSPFAPAEQHLLLVANAFAQSQVLMRGQPRQRAESDMLERGADADAARALAPHKVMPGNRPSSTLLIDHLDANSLGALIALYEHKVFVSSVLWNINAFDQWGVELGKEVGLVIGQALQGQVPSDIDASTRLLVERFRRANS